jgi:uncharacterized protein YbjT (DUF2867 family)
MDKKNVLLIGATGLVGSETLKLLLADDDISSIKVLTRRTTGINHPKVEEFITNFEDLNLHTKAFKADAIICTLGTTIKKAGTQEKFKLVDYEYPLRSAKLGIENGVKHYLLISSIGASPDSKVFYLRTKGELEKDLMSLNFERLTIVRPSLLLGKRKEYRFGEELGKWFGFLFPGKYRPVHAENVAKKLVELIKTVGKGYQIIESREI